MRKSNFALRLQLSLLDDPYFAECAARADTPRMFELLKSVFRPEEA